MQFHHPYAEDTELIRIILHMVLVLQAFIKVLFFMRLADSTGFLVQMVILSILDLRPFFMFFSLWVLFFTCETTLLKAEYSEDVLDDYQGLPEIARMLII